MELDKTFEALSSRVRREILAHLSAQEMSAGDIAKQFDMSAPAISRHLSVLENAELIASERRGQFVFYRLNRDNLLTVLSDYALSICPVGGPIKRRAKTAKKAAEP